jgi:hypothetical protein
MATYTIKIECDNAAFEDGNGGGFELARILRRVADKVEAHGADYGVRILDSNGNHVGDSEYTNMQGQRELLATARAAIALAIPRPEPLPMGVQEAEATSLDAVGGPECKVSLPLVRTGPGGDYTNDMGGE